MVNNDRKRPLEDNEPVYEPDTKRRKRNNNDDNDEHKTLSQFVKTINGIYLMLLKYSHNLEQYKFYEKTYRSEQQDIEKYLKSRGKTTKVFRNKEYKVNHRFGELPLDNVDVNEITEEDNEGEEEESDEDITYTSEETEDEEEEEEETDETDSDDSDYCPPKKQSSENFLDTVFKIIKTGQSQNEDAKFDNMFKNSKLTEKEQQYVKDEYKKIKELKDNKVPNKLKILQMDIPVAVKMELLEKIESIEGKFNSDNKTEEWIKQVLKIPFGKYVNNNLSNKSVEEITKFIKNFHDTLNESIYGQDNVKETLIEIITKWSLNKSSGNKGHCIAINGPAGVGKTSIVKSLAKALNRPFCSFSLAGMSDENYLSGFPFTYEGSTCGRFAKMLMDTGCMNPIIFMDELDKVDTKRSMSVYNKLIEITDFSQNHEIEDHYFGSNIKMDMSQCIFIFSLNNINLVDPILRDRLEVINVGGFDSKEKFEIAKKYLIPEELKNYPEKLEFSDDVIRHIIMRTKQDQGVRNLKRNIEKILRKINLLKYYNDGNISYKTKNTEITCNLIDKLIKDENKINPVILRMYS